MSEAAASYFKEPGLLNVLEADIDPAKIPDPKLWTILIEPIKVEETSRGGIVMAQETQQVMEHLRCVGRVLKLGPLCYADPRFQGHAACEQGDWVVYHAYNGLDFEVLDRTGRPVKLRIINDDEVKATAPDPNALLIPI